MIEFNAAKTLALEELRHFNYVSILEKERKRQLGFIDEEEIWEVETEINIFGLAKEIIFHLWINPDFPIQPPLIYLEPKFYNHYKYIPHVDSNRLVCTFDFETTRTDHNNPLGIILECIKKAKNIIQDGITKKNLKDFEIEFLAYWESIYPGEKVVRKDVLSLVGNINNEDEIYVISLETKLSGYNHVIYKNDNFSKAFISFLEEFRIKYIKEPIFNLGNIPFSFIPPFNLKNSDIVILINELAEEKQSGFEKYINSNTYNKFVIATVLADNKPHIIAWSHKKLNVFRKGFRPKAVTSYLVLNSFQKHDVVDRISPEVCTTQRSNLRTIGTEEETTKSKFLIAGIGSVGSNLSFFLNSFSNVEFKLIDDDDLKIENIGRHFLGFEYVGLKKTKALSNYLRLKNPLQINSTYEKSILSVCSENISYVNDSDYLFLTTGKTNIDKWVAYAQEAGLITKPIFIIWVEPYLSGGHCIYLAPNDHKYKNCFDEDDFFNFNIIKKEEYLINNPKLILRESGCQTTYMPYAGNEVIKFLSSLFPQIHKIITKKETKTRAFSWIGDLTFLLNEKIETSLFANLHSSGEIIEHSI